MQARAVGFSLAGVFLPFGVIFGFAFFRLRRRSASLLTMALVAVLSLGALMATGCNSFGASTVTPGNYTVEITERDRRATRFTTQSSL